jgi:hypothetical protein
VTVVEVTSQLRSFGLAAHTIKKQLLSGTSATGSADGSDSQLAEDDATID